MNIEKMKKQTFIVEVIDRHRSIWQGQIFWVQGNEKISFCSVMEMLRLMDSVINNFSESQ